MYIGGSWVTTEEKRPVINSANESTISEVSEAEAEHATEALEAARKA
jgi:acyl-CoA reductase-like NAD-dependent aldehyde dehydrogenase